MKVVSSHEFNNWYEKATLREQAQVDARIARIEENNHLGDWKYIGDGLAELRWKNGRRIYFTKLKDKIILLLIGRYKNVQKKNLKEALVILRRYADFESQR